MKNMSKHKPKHHDYPDWEMHMDGCEVGYSLDCLDESIEVTHLDGVPVGGPFWFIEDMNDIEGTSCDDKVLVWCIEEQLADDELLPWRYRSYARG